MAGQRLEHERWCRGPGGLSIPGNGERDQTENDERQNASHVARDCKRSAIVVFTETPPAVPLNRSAAAEFFTAAFVFSPRRRGTIGDDAERCGFSSAQELPPIEVWLTLLR